MSRETKQIFVIEDNEADASLMEEALATAGLQYEVTRFRDGTEAMRFLLAQGTLVPDAILLDLEMPQSEGLDILRRIRATPKLSEIPVGIVTGSNLLNDEQRAKRIGASRYVHKPSSYDQFVNGVRQAVKQMLERPGAA